MAKHVFYFLALLVVSWCSMTFTHEMGHIVGGWLSGGILQTADLLPWHLPYSIFDPDPMPLVTLWCGPMLGVFVPLVIASIVRRQWMWFVAYFCMLSNGAYIATAWISGDRFLDTTRLLEQGAHPAVLAIYCILTIGIGYLGFRRSCVCIFAPAESDQPNSNGNST